MKNFQKKMNTKNVINFFKPSLFSSFYFSRKSLYLDIHDDIGTLYQISTETNTLLYIKFNLNTGEEIQLPYSTNNRIMKIFSSTYNNQIIKFNGELLYINSNNLYDNSYTHNNMYKITNNEVTQYNYGHIPVNYISMDYIFILNGDLAICSKDKDTNTFIIYNFRTKESVKFNIFHEVFIKRSDITYFSTSTKLYLYIIDDGVIYEVDLTNLEINKIELPKNTTIKKISEYEFIYIRREYCLLYIYNFENSKDEYYSIDEMLSHSEHNVLDNIVTSIICKYKYKNNNYLLTTRGIYVLNKIKYSYPNTNNMITIGNGNENISISLDTLKERSLVYKNMFSDLGIVETNPLISDNYSNMKLYLEFINTGDYSRMIFYLCLKRAII